MNRRLTMKTETEKLLQQIKTLNSSKKLISQKFNTYTPLVNELITLRHLFMKMLSSESMEDFCFYENKAIASEQRALQYARRMIQIYSIENIALKGEVEYENV